MSTGGVILGVFLGLVVVAIIGVVIWLRSNSRSSDEWRRIRERRAQAVKEWKEKGYPGPNPETQPADDFAD